MTYIMENSMNDVKSFKKTKNNSGLITLFQVFILSMLLCMLFEEIPFFHRGNEFMFGAATVLFSIAIIGVIKIIVDKTNKKSQRRSK